MQHVAPGKGKYPEVVGHEKVYDPGAGQFLPPTTAVERLGVAVAVLVAGLCVVVELTVLVLVVIVELCVVELGVVV